MVRKPDLFSHKVVLENIIYSLSDCALLLDNQRKIITLNPPAEKYFKFSSKSLVAKNISALIPNLSEKLFNKLKRSKHIELDLITKSKKHLFVDISLSKLDINKNVLYLLLVWENENANGLIDIDRDITDLKAVNVKIKRSLKEKEILLKEVYHRVKNNLQVVMSLLHIQSKTITDPATLEAFQESQDRIRMMSLIHEKLYESEDLSMINFSGYIHSLVDYLRQAYPTVSKNVDININSQELYLGADKAIPCGLIINEVISNAYKYAFGDERKGEINIEFSSPKKNKHTLVISDNGVGFPLDIDFKKAKSMGMVLINTLTEQIGGTVELDKTSGTKFTIMF
jgi:two-component sensor histidine kinase